MMIVSLYSPNNTYNAQFINNYSYINVVDQIKRLKGVGDVVVFGAAQYAMRIWLKPDKMNSLGISVDDVTNALKVYNNIYPGGSFGNNPALPGIQNTYTAQLQSRLVSVDAFQQNNSEIQFKRRSRAGWVMLQESNWEQKTIRNPAATTAAMHQRLQYTRFPEVMPLTWQRVFGKQWQV